MHIDLNEFEKINNNLNKYDFMIIDKFNEHDFMKIRKNIDEIYIPSNIYMINGLDIFYTKVNKGSGLKIVENKGNGLKLVKGKGCNMKSKKKWDQVLKY